MSFRFLLVLAAVAATPTLAQEQRFSAVAAITESVVGNHLIPSYERLALEIEILGANFADLCAEPSPRSLARTRASFADVVASWSRINHVRFGPVMDENRLERLHFWPDRRGIGLRQTRALIAGEDEALLQEGALAGQSVAVQGLGAAEVVLFAAGADDMASPPAESYRCRYGRAVAAAMREVASETADAWADPEGYAAHLRDPGPANPLYRDEEEVLAEYVGTLAHGLEAIRDQQILPVFGTDAASAQPRQAIFSRSGLTLEAIHAEFAGLAHFLEISGLGLALPEDERWMAGSAMFEFRNAARILDELPADIGAALTQPEARGKVAYLAIVSRSLQRIMGQNMAAALGLTVGFSALDGD